MYLGRRAAFQTLVFVFKASAYRKKKHVHNTWLGTCSIPYLAKFNIHGLIPKQLFP